MMHLAALLLIAAACLNAQVVELGPPPSAPQIPAKTHATALVQAAAAGTWYDTSDRNAVLNAYNTVFVPANSVPMSWTGAVAGCNAGGISSTWKSAVITHVNWFRAMAGVPAVITLDDTFSAKNQQGALMMSANRALSHTPPTSWTCYTPDGATAAGSSNICYLWGYGNTDPGCVGMYMNDGDSSNTVVGHRRWVVYPQSTKMGTGDVDQTGSYPSGFPRANTLWVIDSATFGGPRPATRDTFVAWPPPGYVPYQVGFSRWSFSFPGADFSTAAVTMTRNGSAVGVTLQPVQNGYGENTLVWDHNMGTANPGSDTPVNVTVSNVRIGGTPQTFTYQVILFDPATASGTPVTLDTNPPHLQLTVDSATYTAPQTFTWTAGSTHTIAVASPQSGAAGVRYAFANWTDSGAISHTITTPAAATSLTANFSTQYLLTTSSSPSAAGTVSANPSSADGYYNSGQNVQVTATVNLGYSFSNWSGDASGTSNPVTIAMNAPKTATAVFTSPTSGLHFVPLPPCRVVDTRGPNGTLSGPIMAAGATRSFPLPGVCGIPSSARAYSLNVTVVPTGFLGYLTIWPTGQPQPAVSTLNALTGQVTANAAIVPAGTNGSVDVYVMNATHVVIDVNGYFDLPQAGALAFYPVTPCRVFDTRSPAGSLGGPSFAAGTSRSFPIQSACGIPAAAKAYALNVTAVPNGPLGYITVWPTGQTQPNASTINASDGQVTANMAIVPAGTNGAVSFFALNTTDLLADINGYFAPPGSAGELKFYPSTPCRFVDTRGPTGSFGGPIMSAASTRSFPLAASSCGVPASAMAYSANFTVVPTGFLGYITVWPTGQTQPVVSTLNALDGAVTANAAIIPAGTGGAVSVYVTGTTDVIIDIAGFFAH